MQLDQDVWTLITTTGAVDPDTAEAVLEALHDEELTARIAAWYPEFERLETHIHIDAVDADRLAAHMASFADAVMPAEVRNSTIAGDNQPLPALVEQMQADALSPAQQAVWGRFLSLIEGRRTE